MSVEMVYRVVIYSIVYDEIIAAIQHYESINLNLGQRFESTIQKALDKLENHPQHYFNLEDGKHRRIPIDGFPYAFIYCIEANEVFVKMLFPQLQDPAKLWARLKM